MGATKKWQMEKDALEEKEGDVEGFLEDEEAWLDEEEDNGE